MLINKDGGHSFLDVFLPLWREKRNWIPLYVLMLIVVILKMKRKSWWWILLLLASVALADVISSHILKPGVDRLRPCQDGSGIEHLMILRLSNCPGNGSFTSSHAANHFAIAFFIFFTQRISMKYSRWLFVLWAAIICWAQVYVGVHYPGDILGGMVIGGSLAYLMNWIYQRYDHKVFTQKNNKL
ncbi:MAG: phosphatase PAP2 family protein [Taibaiella sp.]|nr:phosphatase PAP2 family protein [Taibaiella sp.]